LHIIPKNTVLVEHICGMRKLLSFIKVILTALHGTLLLIFINVISTALYGTLNFPDSENNTYIPEDMACPVRAASSGKHSATVIFLHGLGDTGDGWLQLLSEICPHHIKVLCPNAPTQAVSLNYGMRMPSWFDITSLSFDSEEDQAGIIKSSDSMKKYIEDEVKNGIPHNRIVIGGFSQGGAVGLHTFITHEVKLAGFIGLSTWLPLVKKFQDFRRDENNDTEVFLGHGTSDSVVKFNFGEMTKDALKSHYSNVQWHTYSGLGHSSHPDEMKDLKKFLEAVIPKTS